MQATNTKFYNLILSDSLYIHYNTVKFFELYYKKRLFAVFLFPYIHPRYSYKSSATLLGDDFALNRGSSSASGSADADVCPGNTAFHIAASNGLTDVVRMFLQRSQHYGKSAGGAMHKRYLHEALSTYIELKPENVDCELVHLVNDEPNTPLHYISVIPEGVDEQSVLATAKLLIDNGASISTKGRVGNNAIVEAAQHGQLQMVKLLIREYKSKLLTGRANVPIDELLSLPNDYDENAVILAARGHPDVLEVLLRNGADPNSSRKGYPVLHIVCSRFNLDRHDPVSLSDYHMLMSSPASWGANLPRYTDNGQSSAGSSDTVVERTSEDLDKSRVWPSLRSQDKHRRTISLLIDYGADLDLAESSTGMKPLHVASFWGDQEAVIQLIEAGVDPNNHLNMLNGWLPVHYACSEGQLFAVQTLISYGAHVWDSDEVEPSVTIDPETGTPTLPVPKYPFALKDVELLPQGLHVPAPLELMSFDALKSKIRRFAAHTSSVLPLSPSSTTTISSPDSAPANAFDFASDNKL